VDFGWLWVSDYEWGHIPFHYGRWVHDPFDGWIWIPGYVWAPSWVIWRSGGGYVGWFPMPPTNAFLAGIEIYDNSWNSWARGFGYADWYGPAYGPEWAVSFWIFVDERGFGTRNFHRWAAPRDRVTNIVRNTTNVTNYVTVNNYIVNHSIDTRRIERATGRRVQSATAREIMRRDAPMVPVGIGRQIQQQELRTHGGDVNASPRERLTALPRERALGRERRRETETRQDVQRRSGPALEQVVPQGRRPGLRRGDDEHRVSPRVRGRPTPIDESREREQSERNADPQQLRQERECAALPNSEQNPNCRNREPRQANNRRNRNTTRRR
jgi:hypothetical protein